MACFVTRKWELVSRSSRTRLPTSLWYKIMLEELSATLVGSIERDGFGNSRACGLLHVFLSASVSRLETLRLWATRQRSSELLQDLLKYCIAVIGRTDLVLSFRLRWALLFAHGKEIAPVKKGEDTRLIVDPQVVVVCTGKQQHKQMQPRSRCKTSVDVDQKFVTADSGSTERRLWIAVGKRGT